MKLKRFLAATLVLVAILNVSTLIYLNRRDQKQVNADPGELLAGSGLPIDVSGFFSAH